MSILNVNKINPVGGGSTITISGIASVTGSITGEHHGDGANLTDLNASNISSGTVPSARLGSGTASSSTFLAGDSTFKTVTGTTINNNADNRVITGSGTANTLNGESGLVYNGYNLAISGTGQQQLNIGSTNAGGVAIILDGDSNGDAAGGDYSIIRHNTDGDLEFFARGPAGATNTIFRQGTSEKVRIDAGGNMNITGIVTATAFISSQGALTNRNKIINGDFTIHQRGGTIASSSGNYTLDRWRTYRAGGASGGFSVQQSLSSYPQTNISGVIDNFKSSALITVTSACLLYTSPSPRDS